MIRPVAIRSLGVSFHCPVAKVINGPARIFPSTHGRQRALDILALMPGKGHSALDAAANEGHFSMLMAISSRQ